MFGKALTFVIFGLVVHYLNIYRFWLNWERTVIFRNYPGSCRVVIESGGSEDMTHFEDDVVLISSGFGTPSGSIKALYLDDDSRVDTLEIINAPTSSYFLVSPHGISLWRDPDTGEQFLYVITHHTIQEQVEVFKVIKPLALEYMRTITDPKYTNINDIVAVGRDTFYVTKIAHFRDNVGLMMEMFGNLRFGQVLFFDGQTNREVASGLLGPNGINISPDKTMVYVAEWGGQRLIAFRRDISTNSLVQVWDMFLNTGVDNIEVDPETGNLWIGCHSQTWKIIDFDTNFFNFTPPSQVLRVTIQDNAVGVVEELFSDDGVVISGSAVGTVVKGKLVIGTVFKQTMVCDMNKK